MISPYTLRRLATGNDEALCRIRDFLNFICIRALKNLRQNEIRNSISVTCVSVITAQQPTER